jgi:hypothetical protein
MALDQLPDSTISKHFLEDLSQRFQLTPDKAGEKNLPRAYEMRISALLCRIRNLGF